MFFRTDKKERRTAALIALAVLLAGMLVSFAVFRHQRQQQRSSFAEQRLEGARRYAALVQRQLDAYVAINLSLAAFVSTSGGVDNQRLAAFVHAARHFERLKGISAFGYLPRVAPEMAGALEGAVQDQLPGYHIRQRRLGADFYFPMLYLVDPDPNLVARVRGIGLPRAPGRDPAGRGERGAGGVRGTRVGGRSGQAAGGDDLHAGTHARARIRPRRRLRRGGVHHACGRAVRRRGRRRGQIIVRPRRGRAGRAALEACLSCQPRRR
jgi:hypothetical protein